MALSFSPMLFSIPMIEQLVGSGDGIATWDNVHESAQLSQFVIFFFDWEQSCIVLSVLFLVGTYNCLLLLLASPLFGVYGGFSRRSWEQPCDMYESSRLD